ncbi:MAG: hypothetical protein VYC59_00860, partial [Chloroflexota bacterium]|nr:hypothetical protein [Chloroflexota bacterium]
MPMESVLLQPVLARFGLGDPEWLDPATAAGIVLIGFIVAFLVHRLIFPLIIRFTHWTPTDLDSRLVRSLRWPVTLGILALAGYLAVSVGLDLGDDQGKANTVAGAAGMVVGIIAVAGLLSAVIDWYLVNLASRTNHVVDLRLFPLIRRVGGVVVYGIGALLVLDVMDINISPLIA